MMTQDLESPSFLMNSVDLKLSLPPRLLSPQLFESTVNRPEHCAMCIVFSSVDYLQ